MRLLSRVLYVFVLFCLVLARSASSSSPDATACLTQETPFEGTNHCQHAIEEGRQRSQRVVHHLQERRTRAADRQMALRHGLGECNAGVLEVPRCHRLPGPSGHHEEREGCSSGRHQRCPLTCGQASSVDQKLQIPGVRRRTGGCQTKGRCQNGAVRNGGQINVFLVFVC